VKSVEIICAASSRDFKVGAGTGTCSPGHHSAALTEKCLCSCLLQISVRLPVPAATKHQSRRQPALWWQSLVLRSHVLFKRIWAGLVLAGMAVRSHGSCLFLERKSVFHLGVPRCALLGSKSARQVGWFQLGTWVASEQ